MMGRLLFTGLLSLAIGGAALHPPDSESRRAPHPKPSAAEAGSLRPIASHNVVVVLSHSSWEKHVDALEPDDCFACHDDNSLTMERSGAEVSLFIDPERFTASPHAELDCVDCHVGFDPDEEPHAENIQPVDCSTCHDDASSGHKASAHSPELSCTTCHADVHGPQLPEALKASCATCHEDEVADLALSVHADSRFAPSCLDCHGPHEFEPAVSQTCLNCHGDPEFVAAHVEGEDINHVLKYTNSIHGELIDCSDCHAGHLVYDTDDPKSAVGRSRVASVCAKCHEDVASHYEKSEHAKALATNFAQAPTCTDCHGEHDIHEVTDEASPMSRQHEVAACLNCHLDSPEVQERMTHTAGFVAAYEWSVHGRAAAAGNLEAAICSDCHGAHDALKASNPDAPINKFNIAETCGACHQDIKNTFSESIHGEALSKGVGDAPTCTTCHSEHDILKTADAQSPVAVVNVSAEVCAPCHESFKLSEKYGFPSDRTGSFSDSYHGLAGRFGSAETANCASCHGVHNIWPSSDPRSTVNPANLENTCGSCHPGANANFAKGSVHVVRTADGDRLIYWIGFVYLILIGVTIGGMTLHNIVDWFKKTKSKYHEHMVPTPHSALEERRTGLYVRMNVSERIQHALLAISFLLLVFTGFMLKFPDAWWVDSLRRLLGESLFETRGLVHRISAVVMVADSLYHLYYLSFTIRGRQILKDMLMRKSDFTDMVQMVRYNLGLSSQRPRFARFNYIEKSEYWALMWGTIVMTLTGVVLWFENHFMSEYSKLFVDVNETIHYYEAWLAFLAIVVWHFYYVIFNPDVYPMNFTFLTGKMTAREMAHEHPLELERLERESTKDDSQPPRAPSDPGA